MDDVKAAILGVESLVSGYATKQVLNGIDLHLQANEIVAVIGQNGAGKSTLLKAIFGIIPIWQGQVTYHGARVDEPCPRSWLKLGAVYVPQGNRVFGDLTVGEHLELAGISLPDKSARQAGFQRAVEGWPSLKKRLHQRAATLSGGERQMLSLSMSRVLSPQVLMLDEPSLGLAPQLAMEALENIRRLNDESGVAILVVEQKVRAVLKIAQRVYVLRDGRVAYVGAAAELRHDDVRLREAYL